MQPSPDRSGILLPLWAKDKAESGTVVSYEEEKHRFRRRNRAVERYDYYRCIIEHLNNPVVYDGVLLMSVIAI